MPEEEVQEGPFGSMKLRCRLVRVTYIVILIMFIPTTLGSALGTFIFDLRNWAHEHHYVFYIGTFTFGCGALVLICVVSCSAWLRAKQPWNIIAIISTMLLLAAAFFCGSCIFDIGVFLGIALTPQVLMFSIIILSFFLEVNRYPMYLVAMFVVMTVLTGGFIHLYIEKQVILEFMILVPIIGFVLCMSIIFSTISTLRTVEETGLQPNHYLQAAVYIIAGRCSRKCMCSKCCYETMQVPSK